MLSPLKVACATQTRNVADRVAVLALPVAVLKAFGRVDGLFNVAGIIRPFVEINELDFEVIERVMNVNFWASGVWQPAADCNN